jgi:hypothetical protein
MRFSLRLLVWVAVLLGMACDSRSPSPPPAAELKKLENPEVFWADPGVIQSCDDVLGMTTLHWKVPGVTQIEIRVDAPDGNLFAVSGPEGSQETGNWVKDGSTFYLIDPDSREIVAVTRIRVTRAGCPEEE